VVLRLEQRIAKIAARDGCMYESVVGQEEEAIEQCESSNKARDRAMIK